MWRRHPFYGSGRAAGVLAVPSTLVVDLYPTRSSGSTARNNLRTVPDGCGGTKAVEGMIEGMGTVWCFAFTCLAFALVSCRWRNIWDRG